MTDFKAIEFVFRYGTAEQVNTAYSYLNQIAQDRLDGIKGNMAEKWNNCGIFGFSSGALTECIVRGLFGIDTHATYFTISPKINLLKNGGIWTLSNLKMGNQTYTINVSGKGTRQMTRAGGITQGSNQINYGGSTTIDIIFSGRQTV